MTFRRTTNWEYKGYTYKPWDDYEEDNCKTFHTVIENLYGIEVGWVPMSPYTLVSEDAFQAWIDSGKPSREVINMAIRGNNVSNPSNEDIINFYIEHVVLK